MRRSLSRTQTLRLVQQEGVAANFFSKESKKHNQATLAKEGGRYSVESIISNTLPWFLQPNRRRVALLWKSKCHAACPTQQLATVPAIQALPAIWRLFPDREVQAFTHKRTGSISHVLHRKDWKWLQINLRFFFVQPIQHGLLFASSFHHDIQVFTCAHSERWLCKNKINLINFKKNASFFPFFPAGEVGEVLGFASTVRPSPLCSPWTEGLFQHVRHDGHDREQIWECCCP